MTGAGTGAPTNPDHLRAVQEAVPDAAVWVASGVSPANVAQYPADGFIVGTWLHRDADLDAPLDAHRLAEMRRALP